MLDTGDRSAPDHPVIDAESSRHTPRQFPQPELRPLDCAEGFQLGAQPLFAIGDAQEHHGLGWACRAR